MKINVNSNSDLQDTKLSSKNKVKENNSKFNPQFSFKGSVDVAKSIKAQLIASKLMQPKKRVPIEELISQMDLDDNEKEFLLQNLEKYGLKDNFRCDIKTYPFYINHITGKEVFDTVDNKDDFEKYFVDGYNKIFRAHGSKLFAPEYEQSKIIPLILENIKDFDTKVAFLTSSSTICAFKKFEDYIDNEFLKNTLLKYVLQKNRMPFLDDDKNSIREFTELDYSKYFTGVLADRNYIDIAQAISIIIPRVEKCSNSEEFEELKNLINKLLSAKTPDGNYIFTTLASSDTTTKGMMDGIENILDAKENDTKKYNQLMHYLELTEKGKLPSEILGILFKKSDIVPELNEAINKPESINTYSNKEEAYSNSSFGDVLDIKGQLYYRNKNTIGELKMDKNCFEQLFSNIGNLAISQGALGDCYFVATIYDLINNPNTKGKIYQLFEQQGDNILIHIPDSKNPVVFNIDEFSQVDSKHLSGSLGLEMLERAYSISREDKYSTYGNKLAIAGGKQAQVYNVLLNTTETDTYSTNTDDNLLNATEEDLDEEIRKTEEYIIKTEKALKENKDSMYELVRVFGLEPSYGQLRYLKEIKESFELYKKHNHKITEDELIDMIKQLDTNNCLISVGSKSGIEPDNERMIIGGHAYSVYDIDKENETIDLINPWNTAQYITLSFDEFKKYFSDIDVLPLKN